MAKFAIHGSRGSMPACSADHIKYGGNTTCYSLDLGHDRVIFDAGTGLAHLSNPLVEEEHIPTIHMLFSHFHLDHLMGLQTFMPLYDHRATINFYGDAARKGDWKDCLNLIFRSPIWPVELTQMRSTISFNDLMPTPGSLELGGAKITWCPVNHPQGCLAYRLHLPEYSLVIATDHEPGNEQMDNQLAEFCAGTDYLLFDAHFTPEEYSQYKGWGHGTWKDGVELALEANVKELILIHHHPDRTDKEMDHLVQLAQAFFPHTSAAREDRVIEAAPSWASSAA